MRNINYASKHHLNGGNARESALTEYFCALKNVPIFVRMISCLDLRLLLELLLVVRLVVSAIFLSFQPKTPANLTTRITANYLTVYLQSK